MISLERFRRELGADCPAGEVELRELYEQMSTLARVVVGAIRGDSVRGGRGLGASGRADRSSANDGREVDDADFEERAGILEFDGRMERHEAEREAARMSKRKASH